MYYFDMAVQLRRTTRSTAKPLRAKRSGTGVTKLGHTIRDTVESGEAVTLVHSYIHRKGRRRLPFASFSLTTIIPSLRLLEQWATKDLYLTAGPKSLIRTTSSTTMYAPMYASVTYTSS